MRLWSLHPSYLDSKGLVALWREGLLAKHVLEGKTRGYTNHPQLVRFKKSKDPVLAINMYLEAVAAEAVKRGYSFDTSKISLGLKGPKLSVTDGQVAYEVKHLRSKLIVRDPKRLKDLPKDNIKLHPLFKSITGPIEDWEKIT